MERLESTTTALESTSVLESTTNALESTTNTVASNMVALAAAQTKTERLTVLIDIVREGRNGM